MQMRLNKGQFNKHVRSYGPGEIIFREMDTGNEMYVVIEGKVEISKSTSPTSSKTLIVLGKGDIFGEMAIVDKKKRSATATAVAPTRLLAIDEHLFDATLDKNPDFSRKMIRILSERLRRANTAIQNSLVANREHHVLGGLIQYTEEFGTSTFKGKRIDLEQFVRWASHHIGIGSKDIKPVLNDFLKRGILQPSAKSGADVLFKPPATI